MGTAARGRLRLITQDCAPGADLGGTFQGFLEAFGADGFEQVINRLGLKRRQCVLVESGRKNDRRRSVQPAQVTRSLESIH